MRITPTLGGDPEIFVIDAEKNVKSASEFLKRDLTVGGGTIAKDGLQIELHPAYATCRETFAANVGSLIAHTYLTLNNANLSMSQGSTIKVDQKKLESLPKEVQELGCEPDRSAYSGKVKVLEIDGSKHFKRYAGGHIHFGSSDGRQDSIKSQLHDHVDEIIRLMDYMVGLPWVLIDHNEENAERRKVYGQAGSYRIQPHGIEYRVLPNSWIVDPIFLSLVFLLGRSALYISSPQSHQGNPITLSSFEKIIPAKDVEDVINTNDVEKAEALFKIIGTLMLQIIGPGRSNYLNADVLNLMMYFSQHYDESPIHKSMISNWQISKDGSVGNARGIQSFVENGDKLTQKMRKDKSFQTFK